MDKKIIFMGSGDFAAIILKKLSGCQFRPTAVFTKPDKPAGRKNKLSPSPSKIIAMNFGIEIFEPKSLKSSEIENFIKSINPDTIIVADYGKIIPKNILDIPKYGSINIHPSLLPRHRGATPIHYTLLSGDKKTGVSIILMDEEIDHGPILVSTPLDEDISRIGRIELTEKLAEMGGDILIKILPQWFDGKINPVAQNESFATYTKILTREDGKIDWEKSAEEIERRIRAMEGWPGTWTIWSKENKKLKIFKAEILNGKSHKNPGSVFSAPGGKMVVACGTDSLLIGELQIEGKSKVSGQAFLRGHPGIIGSFLS